MEVVVLPPPLDVRLALYRDFVGLQKHRETLAPAGAWGAEGNALESALFRHLFCSNSMPPSIVRLARVVRDPHMQRLHPAIRVRHALRHHAPAYPLASVAMWQAASLNKLVVHVLGNPLHRPPAMTAFRMAGSDG